MTLGGRSTILILAPFLALATGCGGAEEGPREPEEARCFAISQVLVSVAQRTRGEALAIATDLMQQIRSGRPLAEVARARSDDDGSRRAGGFLGFVNPHHETRFAGAVQTLAEGQLAGPVETQVGVHILYRHPYEEGRRLERESFIPMYGFLVGAADPVEGGTGRTREEARRVAEEAWTALSEGRLSLAEAAAQYADEPPRRADAYLDHVRHRPGQEGFFEALLRVPEGALAPLVEAPGGFAVIARGRFLQSIVRHILVRHVEAERRPLDVRRSRADALARAREALAALAPDGSNWDQVVVRYSEDLGTVPLRGSLGIVTNGALPPDLEAAVLDTEPGRIAARVAESEDGYHVLWRVD